MGSRYFIPRSLETDGQLLLDLWTSEVCHGCLPPHAHGMFEHAHDTFERVMFMFEHAHDMFEHVHDMFEHAHDMLEHEHGNPRAIHT